MSTSANAQVLQVGGVGSSAIFQTATIEAYQEALSYSSGAGYYTLKNGAAIVDQRGLGSINQVGNLSVVWDNPTSPAHVWYYLSVDSVVGNRAYFSQPRATLGAINATTGTGVISTAFFGGAAPQNIPTAVLNVINNSTFTAAFTDIRPEDALFAENRVNCGTPTTATLGCLGYGNPGSAVGVPIKSAFTGAAALPVAFNIFGNDPVTGNAIPTFETVPVGVSPIVFITNRTNANGLGNGQFTGMNFQGSPVLMFSGLNCDTNAFGVSSPLVAVNPILREPMSGTMNTFEYNIMLPFWSQYSKQDFWFSQEGVLTPPYAFPGPNANQLGNWGALQPGSSNALYGGNPLNGGCPPTGTNNGWALGQQGSRMRATSTGDEVGAVKATPDSIGYIFFSYSNVSSISGSPSYGYLTYGASTVNGATVPTDPINPSGSYTTPYTVGGLNYPGNGQLPICTAPCKVGPNVSFPNVRNGAYLQWSLLRAVADAGSQSLTNLNTLAAGIAKQVNLTSPDFVPFSPTPDGDNGIQFYRSHFQPVGINFNAGNSPNNGVSGTTGAYVPNTEAGGDVGGCVDWRYPPNGPTSLLNCRY